MKTPRDLLLARHEHAVPRLDAIRRAVVAEHVTGPDDGTEQPASNFLGQLWVELFWSPRKAWASLAAAWMLLLGLNVTSRDTFPGSAETAGRPPSLTAPELKLVLAEQGRLRASLLQPETSPGPEPANRPVPGPRSDNPAHRCTA